MKKTICLTLFTAAFIFTSCEDEQTESNTHTLTITETSRASDDPTLVTHIEKFTYRDNKLKQYTNSQSYNEDIISTNTDVRYKKDSVIISDDRGKQYIYLIDSYSHAVMCKFKEPGTDSERLHVFTTNTEGFIDRMVEYINKELYYSITFDYQNGNLYSITTGYFYDHQSPTETSVQLFTTGTIPNKDGLPFLPLTEVYPLNFHKAAYYAGIMGTPIKNLPVSSRFEGNAHEQTLYDYKTNADGRITSCTVNTISYGSSYKRAFQYSYE